MHFSILKGFNYFNDADVWCTTQKGTTTLKFNFTVALSSVSLFFIQNAWRPSHATDFFHSLIFYYTEIFILWYFCACVVYQSSESNLSHTCWINLHTYTRNAFQWKYDMTFTILILFPYYSLLCSTLHTLSVIWDKSQIEINSNFLSRSTVAWLNVYPFFVVY